MNRNKFNYVSVCGYEKVFIEIEKTDAQQTRDVEITPFVRVLLDRLIASRPEWIFVYSGYTSRAGKIELDRFGVYLKGEHIGSVGRTSRHRSGQRYDTYYADSRHIEVNRGHKETKNLDGILKVIYTTFKPRTIEERLDEARGSLVAEIRREYSRADWGWQRDSGGIMNELEKYLADNWTDVIDHLRGLGVEDKHIPFDAVETISARHTAHDMRSYSEEKKGYIVIQYEGGYCIEEVKTGENSITNIVPEGIRANLGFLKMQSDGTILKDIGYKKDENTYYVLPDKEI